MINMRHVGPLSMKLKQDAAGLRSHGFVNAAPLLEGRAAEARALEARLMSAEEKVAELEELNRGASQLWRDAMEREARLREIVEMAWKGYGYDQEWDCDCPVCAAIRTRTPYGTKGENDVDRATQREYREWREQKAKGENDGEV